MEMVQLAIQSAPYAKALRELLSRTGTWDGVPVEEPDLEQEGVLVMDCEHLERLTKPLPNPERVVLITNNDPQHLSRAWEAGVHSVVFDHDPLSTVVLAIMAAGLRRLPKDKAPEPDCGFAGTESVGEPARPVAMAPHLSGPSQSLGRGPVAIPRAGGGRASPGKH
jgi:hypothetical protein